MKSASVRYYHCSLVDHPVGLRLTGPAQRHVASQWADRETSYDPDMVYVFGGDGDPRLLGDSAIADQPQYVYEVEPEGPLVLDERGSWFSFSCRSAVILSCVHRPIPTGGL